MGQLVAVAVAATVQHDDVLGRCRGSGFLTGTPCKRLPYSEHLLLQLGSMPLLRDRRITGPAHGGVHALPRGSGQRRIDGARADFFGHQRRGIFGARNLHAGGGKCEHAGYAQGSQRAPQSIAGSAVDVHRQPSVVPSTELHRQRTSPA
jgi:hypothetical protein